MPIALTTQFSTEKIAFLVCNLPQGLSNDTKQYQNITAFTKNVQKNERATADYTGHI